MEKSLPATAFYSIDDEQQTALEQGLDISGGYDTQLIPHISLPQRRQTIDNAAKRSGLLGFAFPKPIESSEDAGLTMAFSKQEIAQGILMAQQQIQSAPTLASISATFANTSKHPYMQDQATKLLQGSIAPEYTGQLVTNSPGKRRSYEEQEIVCMRTQILIKAIVALILFVGVGGIIWIFFSHATIYLLILFIVLAIIFGSIFSKFIGDYYQFNLHGIRPMQPLRAPGNTNGLQGNNELRPERKSDTSGYLHALKDVFHENKTIGITNQPL